MISLVFVQFCIFVKLIGDSFGFLAMWAILFVSVKCVYFENILCRASMSTHILYDLTCTIVVYFSNYL